MSDTPNPNGAAAPVEDPIKNLKAEFDRKTSNIEAKLLESNAALKQLLEQTKKPEPKKETEESIKDLWYTDEEAAANKIVERAVSKATEVITRSSAAERRTQEVANQIYQDYPEVADQSSDLFKKANEIYAALPAEEKASPYAMKMAVKEAAMELEVKPRSKRPKVDDSFSVPSGKSSRPSKTLTEVPSDVLQTAALMGLDVSNPKVKESLLARVKKGSSNE